MPRRERLYVDGEPVGELNRKVRGWLSGDVQLHEHKTPAAFDMLRRAYCDAHQALADQQGGGDAEAHRALLSSLTDLLLGQDISSQLAQRLSGALINPGGTRTALAQGYVKNVGENFINVLVYALADTLADRDDILVDKGLPAPLKPYLEMTRTFRGSTGHERDIQVKIECDFAIWPRERPEAAIVVSAKTRLKEVFHIGTMWKMMYDVLGDEHCKRKWGLTGPELTPDMLYVFATADGVPAGGAKTQGPDVERDEVRNLIAMDASFFDYVFVSKSGISHVAADLDLARGREALFHEMGCLLDLIEQRFDVTL